MNSRVEWWRIALMAYIVPVILLLSALGVRIFRDLSERVDPTEVRRMSDGTPVEMDAKCRLLDVRTGEHLDPKKGFTSYDQTRWETLCARYQHERPDRPRRLCP